MAKGMNESLQDSLTALIPKLVDSGQVVSNLTRLSGGASQETYAFDVQNDQDTIKLILRRSPTGLERDSSTASITLSQEAELIELAGTRGVPVPKVIYVCDSDDNIGDAFVMSREIGETVARKILRDDTYKSARKLLAQQCGSALAKIHSVDIDSLDWLQKRDGIAQLDRYEEIFRGFNLHRPIFELAIRWLRDNPPKPAETVLAHGDFRLGNLMVDENGLGSVLDWELAHLGDPREDIAWICVNSWRFGVTENRVGGFGNLNELLEAYNEVSGRNFSANEIDWFEILGSLKWGIMCMTMYEVFRSGADPSVERAAIGRRVSETEIDIINLLERL